MKRAVDIIIEDQRIICNYWVKSVQLLEITTVSIFLSVYNLIWILLTAVFSLLSVTPGLRP